MRADETPGPQQQEPSHMDATAMEVGAVSQLCGNEAMTGTPVVLRHRGAPQPDVMAIVSAER